MRHLFTAKNHIATSARDGESRPWLPPAREAELGEGLGDFSSLRRRSREARLGGAS